jgi:hypothetical protein
MSVKIITSHNEEDFIGDIPNIFYNHFCPDDWDYMIIGEDRNEVDDLAYKLQVCTYELENILFEDGSSKWVAVTYHG